MKIQVDFQRKGKMRTQRSYQSTRSRKRKKSAAQVESEKTIQPILYQRFLKFLTKSRETKLINGIYNYYGKNFSIQYKEKFNFHERWEEQRAEHMGDDYLEDISPAFSLLSLITLIMNAFSIWVLSTQRYFGTHLVSDHLSLYNVLIGLKFIEIAAKSLVRMRRDDWNGITALSFFKINMKELFCIGYFIYIQFGVDNSNALEHMVELFVYYLLWSSASNIYQNFKLRSFALKYENQLKIFDLLVNIFIQAHIFSILMILASSINPNNNWTSAIGISEAAVFTKYLYAFYFSCTTMLTIGYGDITPKNPGEVMVVILIQIIGVVSFGYLLNQMGHTLSKIRQEKEALEKDLQTIGKMANYYNLEKNLENRAKKYIVSNNKMMDELRPDEENRLLMKLNDQLRTQITNENYLSILKTSIFFLCHWSKGFQSQVAKSLEKRLFSPNQRLGDVSVNERIYIIKTGKVCVYMNRFNNHNKKLLRTIEIDPELSVCDNIYGYTSAFSNRVVHLQAIAKQLTTTYSITKDRFLLCVGLDKKDLEYYHEIKCRIDQSSFCEEWEAPSIKNIREHYIPSQIFLIKKHRARLIKEVNERETIKRRPKHKYNLFNNLIISNAEAVNPFNSSYTLGDKTLQFRIADPINAYEKNGSMNLSDEVSESSDVSNETPVDSENRSEGPNFKERSLELAREFFRTRKQTLALQQSENKQIIAYIFQKRRDYSNFFPKNNFNHVLLRFQKQNCLESGFISNQQCT